MIEEWMDIIGYEGAYQISNTGRVRSMTRWIGGKKFVGRILKLWINRTGYYTVSICLKYKQRTIEVHTLVAKHFVDNLENKPEVNHEDGVKLNNLYSNLKWVTSSENKLHAYATGLKVGKYSGTRIIDGVSYRVQTWRDKLGPLDPEWVVIANRFCELYKFTRLGDKKIFMSLGCERHVIDAALTRSYFGKDKLLKTVKIIEDVLVPRLNQIQSTQDFPANV